MATHRFHLWLVLVAGFFVQSLAPGSMNSIAGLERPFRMAKGSYVTVELEAMPEKYQIETGFALDYFTASPDSSFWCGPNRPNPISWLSTSVICRNRCDFQVLFCTAEGDSLDMLDFVGVEPATYRVGVGKAHRPEPGLYMLQFRYKGSVVDEYRVQIPDPR